MSAEEYRRIYARELAAPLPQDVWERNTEVFARQYLGLAGDRIKEKVRQIYTNAHSSKLHLMVAYAKAADDPSCYPAFVAIPLEPGLLPPELANGSFVNTLEDVERRRHAFLQMVQSAIATLDQKRQGSVAYDSLGWRDRIYRYEKNIPLDEMILPKDFLELRTHLQPIRLKADTHVQEVMMPVSKERGR